MDTSTRLTALDTFEKKSHRPNALYRLAKRRIATTGEPQPCPLTRPTPFRRLTSELPRLVVSDAIRMVLVYALGPAPATTVSLGLAPNLSSGVRGTRMKGSSRVTTESTTSIVRKTTR